MEGLDTSWMVLFPLLQWGGRWLTHLFHLLKLQRLLPIPTPRSAVW